MSTSSIRNLTIPSDPAGIIEVENAFNQLAERYKLPSEKCSDILVSLYEAVTNAILHGNKADKNKRVNIAFSKKVNSVCIKISDQGQGFDPNQVPDPTCPENVCTCGGRGVYLMQQLSDKIEYSNQGRTVKLHFRIA